MVQIEGDTYDDLAYTLMGSFSKFTRYFFKQRLNRKFNMENPWNRESHYVAISRELTKVHRGEISNLLINIPPRYGKTEKAIHFIAWTLAINPSCLWLYTSYSHTLAAKQTATIKEIILLDEYQRLFPWVRLKNDTKAKDNFETTSNGGVVGVGAGGSITGRGAGISDFEGFGGGIIIDDIIKPYEATSDTVRESRNDWYLNTLTSRLNTSKTPIIFIGQRVHEDDLAGRLINGYDGRQWSKLIVPALDSNNNALLPRIHTVDDLRRMRDVMPYVFSSQYQQDPQPAGGSIFKKSYFVFLDEMPKILATFITVDTAETDKDWNDATVFSFFGLYDIELNGRPTGEMGLVWLDCKEIRVQPKDLEGEFLSFYTNCLGFRCMGNQIKPHAAYIETKSTGTTLYSVASELPGLNVIEIKRKPGESKTSRFLRAQPEIASKKVVFIEGARHANHCIEHMSKITANDTHRNDDIADTCADGVKIGLIDKAIPIVGNKSQESLKTFTHRYANQRRTILGG
jgi:hypothetical protein